MVSNAVSSLPMETRNSSVDSSMFQTDSAKSLIVEAANSMEAARRWPFVTAPVMVLPRPARAPSAPLLVSPTFFRPSAASSIGGAALSASFPTSRRERSASFNASSAWFVSVVVSSTDLVNLSTAFSAFCVSPGMSSAAPPSLLNDFDASFTCFSKSDVSRVSLAKRSNTFILHRLQMRRGSAR